MPTIVRRGIGMRRLTRRAGQGPTPTRADAARLVASYGSYEDARAAVDRLALKRFPVHRLSIAAADAVLVERIDGGTSGGVIPATTTGALAGACVGLTLGVVDWTEAAVPLLWVVVLGFIVGALAGVVTGLVALLFGPEHQASGSRMSVEAARFDLLSDPALTAVAAGLLAEQAGR
jgi:hypothetical protein